GVSDESEEVAGLNFHPLVHAGGPAVEVRVVEGCAALIRQPEAVSALWLIADVADDAVLDGDDGRPFRGEDVDAGMEARSAIPRRVPRVVEIARLHADDRHVHRGAVQRRE